MVDAGIEEGDLIVIRKQETASVGDIVVALDDENQNTLKTFAGIDMDSGFAMLKYENNRKYQNKEIHVNKLVVQGVAKHVIKAL
jgi:repressor LexA